MLKCVHNTWACSKIITCKGVKKSPKPACVKSIVPNFNLQTKPKIVSQFLLVKFSDILFSLQGSSFTSGASTGNHTPGGPGLNLGCSPKKSSSPPRKGSDQKALTSSAQKGRTSGGGTKKQPNHIPPAGRSGRGSKKSSGTPAGSGSGTATPKSSTGGLPINKLPPDNAGVRLPKLGKVDHQRPKKTEQQYSEEREVIRMMKEELYPTKKINELDTLNETENED